MFLCCMCCLLFLVLNRKGMPRHGKLPTIVHCKEKNEFRSWMEAVNAPITHHEITIIWTHRCCTWSILLDMFFPLSACTCALVHFDNNYPVWCWGLKGPRSSRVPWPENLENPLCCTVPCHMSFQQHLWRHCQHHQQHLTIFSEVPYSLTTPPVEFFLSLSLHYSALALSPVILIHCQYSPIWFIGFFPTSF